MSSSAAASRSSVPRFVQLGRVQSRHSACAKGPAVVGGEPSFAGASPLTQLCQHRTFTGSVFPAARLSAMPAAATGRPSSVPRSFADELRNRGEIIESEGGRNAVREAGRGHRFHLQEKAASVSRTHLSLTPARPTVGAAVHWCSALRCAQSRGPVPEQAVGKFDLTNASA